LIAGVEKDLKWPLQSNGNGVRMKRSNNTELMREAIASDFAVQQVAEDKNWLLFAREGKDFFHFVEYDTETNKITQHHVPHLAVARGIEAAESGRSKLTDEAQGYVASVQGKISIASQIGSEMFFVIDGDAIPFSVLRAGIDERLKRTFPMLTTARKRVVFERGRYEIPGAMTHHGNPLSSVSKDLIEGISFEKLLRRRLNARDFGLYSAFCTHADFPCALDKGSCIKELLDRHIDCYGEDLPDNVLGAVAPEVQGRLFPFSIWGPGVTADPARAIDALEQAVAKLDPVQRTQVVLLNGMHGANIFLAMAAVTGILSFEQYRDFQAADFAPDSEEEQFLRISTSFIELFGEVAPPCPGYAGNRKPKAKRVSRTASKAKKP
jgi:predicted transcriptional regulator